MSKQEAIIEIDVPDFQIGQKVSIYFPDTMKIEGIVNKKENGHWIEREIEDTLRWKECSECHSEYPNMNGLNYCPNCGTKMEENKQ